jgi:phosphatidylinositol alpha-1,6-mannosyltransferase
VQVAGRSGGAHEAVEHDKTGLVVDEPSDPTAVAAALASVLEDPERRRRLGKAARKRVEEDFDYDVLAARLRSGIEQAGG